LGPIAFAAAVQLAASIPNFLMTEHVTLGEGYLKKPFVVDKGYVNLPTAPGLGIELDEEALADKLGGPDWHPGEAFETNKRQARPVRPWHSSRRQGGRRKAAGSEGRQGFRSFRGALRQHHSQWDDDVTKAGRASWFATSAAVRKTNRVIFSSFG
jgi:hypothetical protein